MGVLIENSVTRVTLPCAANSYSYWRNLQFALHNCYGFFFLHTLPFINMRYFINFMLKYLHLPSRNARFGSCLQHWRRKIWWKVMSKTDVITSKMSSWCHAWESSYTPWYKTTFSGTGLSFRNLCRVWKKYSWPLPPSGSDYTASHYTSPLVTFSRTDKEGIWW